MIKFRPCKQINNYLQFLAKQCEISLISLSHTHTCKEKKMRKIKKNIINNLHRIGKL